MEVEKEQCLILEQELARFHIEKRKGMETGGNPNGVSFLIGHHGDLDQASN